MCAMALVHSRAARVVLCKPAAGARGPGRDPLSAGGVLTGAGLPRAGGAPPARLHGLSGLNHRFAVFRVDVGEEEGAGRGGG